MDSRNRTLRHAVLVLALLLLGPAPAFPGAESETVSFETLDRVTLKGQFTAPPGWVSGSAVIGLHMFLGDRSQFGDFAEELARRNIAFLAIDLRGHGGSRMRGGEDLRPLALDQDPEFFGGMHQDVAAAVRFLELKGFDRSRIGLLGANLGADVALDYAARNLSVPCAALLTPLLRQPGIDMYEAARRFGQRPALVLSAEKDLGKGARTLAGRLLAGARVRLEVHKDGPAHGTALLEKMPGARELVAEWFAERLAADIRLDGVIRGRESARAELRRIDDRDPGQGSLLVRRFPDHLYLAARSSARPQQLELNIAGRLCRFDKDGLRRVEGRRELALPLPSGSLRAVGRDVIELLLPVGGFGLERGKELRMSVRFLAGGKWSDSISGLRLYFARLPKGPNPSD